MSRIAYVNGQYLPRNHAAVHIEDRGYQFSDGVYEVCEVRGGRLVDQRRHMERLVRSLGELRIKLPMPLSALNVVLHEDRCAQPDQGRHRLCPGDARRRAARPSVSRRPSTKPAIVVTANTLDMAKSEAMATDGVAVITLPDNRWERVDIKAIALLPNVLAKQAAREQGAREAWYVDKDNRVTEGSSSNAWIVTRDGKVVTRQADQRHPQGHHAGRGHRHAACARPRIGGAAVYRRGGL